MIQSLAAQGLPAARGGSVILNCSAQSPDGSALAYSWAVSAGWTVSAGAGTSSITVVAPAAYSASGSATLTVTDAAGRTATGLIALRTVDNSLPVIHALNASPNPMNRGTNFTASVTASDANGDGLSYQWTLPAGFTLLSGQGAPTITARADRFTSGDITVAVSDGAANASALEYVRTRDGQWHTPLSIAGGSTDLLDPKIAMNGSGEAVAVWEEVGSGGVSARPYDADTGWGFANQLTDSAGGSAPQIAIDSAGNAIAVYLRPDAVNTIVYARRYSPQSGWAAAVPIGNTGVSFDPDIAMTPSGDAVVVWRRANDVYANRYLRAAGWQTPARIDASAGAVTSQPQVAITGNGDAVATWVQGTGVYATHLTASVWTGTAQFIVSANSKEPQVVMDATGNAIVVWHEAQFGNESILTRRYTAGAGWDIGEQLSDTSGQYVRIAANAAGVAVAVWEEASDIGITTRRFVPGSGWGPAEHVDLGFSSVKRPDVAIDPIGNAWVTWRQADSGSRDYGWVNRYDSLEGWSGAHPFDDEGTGAMLTPRIATNSSGVAIAVWQQPIDVNPLSPERIWASEFR